jgi:type I restriction enzyme S subunit
LRLNSIERGYIETEHHKEGDWSREEAEKFIVEDGDFYVSRGNGSLDLIGRGGLVDSISMELAFPDTMMRVRVNSDCFDLHFLRLVWDSRIVRRHIESKARTSAGIYKINQGHLKSTILPLPPSEEQNEIVRRVRQRIDKIDQMATHVEQARKRLDHLDRSVLAKAFRGELVKTEAERARREGRDYETAEELLARISEDDASSNGAKASKQPSNGRQLEMDM